MTLNRRRRMTFVIRSPVITDLNERAGNIDKQIKALNLRVLEYRSFVEECFNSEIIDESLGKIIENHIPPIFLRPLSTSKSNRRIYNHDVTPSTIIAAYANSERQALSVEYAAAAKQVADIDSGVKVIHTKNPGDARVRWLDNWVEEFKERLPVVEEGIKGVKHMHPRGVIMVDLS